jgi:hypothetical protein
MSSDPTWTVVERILGFSSEVEAVVTVMLVVPELHLAVEEGVQSLENGWVPVLRWPAAEAVEEEVLELSGPEMLKVEEEPKLGAVEVVPLE